MHGLARVYSGLKAETSYTAFRGEQTISWASIEEAHKDLERGPCDWIGVKGFAMGNRDGTARRGPGRMGNGAELVMAEDERKVNELDSENATTAKLKNCLGTYRSILGPELERDSSQVSREVTWFG